MNISDIVIIGSGAAATTTLIELFTKLLDGSFTCKKLNVTVVEKYPEFWKGIPYGSRSSINSLTITDLSDFIPSGPIMDVFLDWLKTNQEQWIHDYKENGGIAANQWLEKNLPFIENDEWDRIYLPRFVYGIYMHGKMLDLLQKVEEHDLVRFMLIQAEAIDVNRENGIYDVTIEYQDKSTSVLSANKLLIAIGSAPVRNNVGMNAHNEYVYINDLYEPFLDDNLKVLKNTLASTPNPEERNLLVIGSNASCIELMYILNHRPDILDVTNKMVAVSHTGILPYQISEMQHGDDYSCENLDQLKKKTNYNIHELIEATKKDIQLAVKQEVVVPYVNHIINYTIELMQVLCNESKQVFFAIYGPELSRLIRRSGPAYKDSSDDLIQKKKLQLLKGKFSNIKSNSRGGLLNYIDLDNRSHTYHLPFKVVINCSGSENLRNSSSRLIFNLVKKNICSINLSEKGFLVNEKFEAAPNLYIMGPLLGGNMNKLIHFWHLENLKRLLYLSPHLAEILLSEHGEHDIHIGVTNKIADLETAIGE